jgi:hypothetical protein
VQYDIEWVRGAVEDVKEDGGGNIRIHPNGFIQVDLQPVEENWRASHHKGHSGASLRLHIWNPPGFALPRQETHNELHTHVFDMHSSIIKGTMQQRIYSLVVGSEWHEHRGVSASAMKVKLYKAVYGKASDSRLEDTGIRGLAVQDFTWGISAGQSYTQPAHTFHDSDARNCVVTIMEKTEIHPGDAYVLVPTNIEPDNEFDRASASTPEYLWAAVKAALA